VTVDKSTKSTDARSLSGYHWILFQPPETTMQALIDKHFANPTDKTLARIKAYALKHPFSVLLLDASAQRYLKTLGI